MSATTFQLCVWAEVPGRPGYYDCLHCKLPLGHPRGQRAPRPYPEKVRRECKPPSPAVKRQQKAVIAANPVRRYLTARDKWIAAGKPLRDAAERRTLFAICEACPEYQPLPVVEGGRCKACSCGIARERDTLNKIAWATEECPRGRWPINKRHPDPDDGRAG